MAHTGTIVCVSQHYVGLAWVHYNAAFHRQAALTNNVRDQLYPLHDVLHWDGFHN